MKGKSITNFITSIFIFSWICWGIAIALRQPHATLIALMLALFELSVGLLLIGKGNPLKYAVVASILFNGFRVVLGLSGQATDWRSDFLVNRLPNLILIAIQIPLLFSTFDRSLPEAVSSFFRGRFTCRPYF